MRGSDLQSTNQLNIYGVEKYRYICIIFGRKSHCRTRRIGQMGFILKACLIRSRGIRMVNSSVQIIASSHWNHSMELRFRGRSVWIFFIRAYKPNHCIITVCFWPTLYVNRFPYHVYTQAHTHTHISISNGSAAGPLSFPWKPLKTFRRKMIVSDAVSC